MKISKAVNSSAIRALHYEPDYEKLVVEFVKGTEYSYYNVPEGVFEEFVVAESVGKYYNSFIKGNPMFLETSE